MQLLLSELKNFKLAATDNDDIGEPKDFLLDDEFWAVRYLVLKAHPWIPLSKKVLITPISLGLPNTDKHLIPVNLTHEKIKDGPHLDDHLPVSRANEIELFHHYGYAYYWMGPGLWGTYPHPGALIDQEALDQQKQAGPSNGDDKGNLRSYKEMMDYSLRAGDLTVGKVLDLIINDTSWSVEYFVVSIENKSDNHFRLIPTQSIKRVDWPERSVFLDMSKEAFEGLKEYSKMEQFEVGAVHA